ncbi:MAG: DUF4440 domain-containing protein, partial [Terrimicrobiaceae bacterium]
AISFALPILGQQTNTPDPQLRQQILAFVEKFDPAFNNNDPAATAALYTDDAVLVVPEGLIYGRKAIKEYYADFFGKVHFSNHRGTLDQYSPHMIGTSGNEMWAAGEWSQTIVGPNIGVKGYWSGIVVREGDAWKFRLHAITPPPPPSPEPAPQSKASGEEIHMAKIYEQRNFRDADQTLGTSEHKVEVLNIGGGTIARVTLSPGFKFSDEQKKTGGSPWCELRHAQYQVSGRLHIKMKDGTEFEMGPGDVTVFPEGHDAWVVGSEPVVMIDWVDAAKSSKK